MKDKWYRLDEIEELKKKEVKTKGDEAKVAFFDKIYEAAAEAEKADTKEAA